MNVSVACEGREGLAPESMIGFLFCAVSQACMCTTDIRNSVYTIINLYVFSCTSEMSAVESSA
jgi:hypothetical protein